METDRRRVTTEDLKEQVTRVGEDLAELTRQVRRLARGSVRAAGSSLGNVVEAGWERARTFEKGACDFIRDRPLRSLGLAIGIGALIGLLVRRR
jgi:ElaB/YqjD/DUF883 family membrane-anchored ribosome-binding protein